MLIAFVLRIFLLILNVVFLSWCRTIRWLDRCLKANKRPTEQSIFPIVQGGLDPELRKRCAQGWFQYFFINGRSNYVIYKWQFNHEER